MLCRKVQGFRKVFVDAKTEKPLNAAYKTFEAASGVFETVSEESGAAIFLVNSCRYFLPNSDASEAASDASEAASDTTEEAKE